MKILTTVTICTISVSAFSQLSPAITSWLQNTTVKGRHYVSGNSTPITDIYTANVQSVKYSAIMCMLPHKVFHPMWLVHI